jgi:chromosome segregation ATPase
MSLTRGLLVAGGVLACAIGLSAQQGPPIDPIRELLVEVRGLRAAMERAATVGARVQLLVARIQLQEQRIAELSRRVTSLRSELRSAEQEAAQIGGMSKMLEEDNRLPPEAREHLGNQLVMMKSQLATIEKRRLDLSQEEAFVTQQLAEEQGRWTAINEQLDQLERSLIAGK